MLRRVLIGRAAVALIAMALLCACSGSDDSTPPATHEPTSTPAPAEIISRGDVTEQVVALLFDVGEDDARTEAVLRALRERQARATFVVTGVWGEQHRDLLFSISSEGHQIINGTYDGRSWTGVSVGEPPLSPEERKLALSRAEVTVYRYTSQSTGPYFVPPYGDVDDSVLRDAGANGYNAVVVPAVSFDEDTPVGTAPSVERGDIVGVGSTIDAPTIIALIDALAGQGFGFITIRELGG